MQQMSHMDLRSLLQEQGYEILERENVWAECLLLRGEEAWAGHGKDREDALRVGWCELTTTDPTGRVLYRNAWATSHPLGPHNLVATVAAGRSRWNRNADWEILASVRYRNETRK